MLANQPLWWYPWTGMPVIVESPLSFTGSAKRLWTLRRASVWLAPVAVLLIAVAWTVVLSWYLLFGFLVVPWRLVRRGQRRSKQQAQSAKEQRDAEAAQELERGAQMSFREAFREGQRKLREEREDKVG